MEECPIEWEVEGRNNHNNIASLAELRNLDKLKALSLVIKDVSILPRDMHNVEKLERYYISIGVSSWKWHDCKFSRILMLEGSSIVTLFSNDVIRALLAEVEHMELEDVNGDGFMELRRIVLRELRFLKLLYLKFDTGLAPLTLFEEKAAMPKLETMVLNWIDTCKIWDDDLATQSCIQNLRSLDIRGCNRLTSLFPSSVARAKTAHCKLKLKNLQISSCRKLKMIFAQEDISREEVILPNLETLAILGWNELESLWPSHMAPNSYCKLNRMRISYCHKLLNVFPSYVLNNLHNLETLDVMMCDELEDIFEIKEQSTVGTNKQGLATRLRTLHLSHLPKLKHIWSNDPHGILRFQNLSVVEVGICESLIDYIFPFSVVEDLQQLQKLQIGSRGIENIFEKSHRDEVKLVSLGKLRVWGCDRLKNMVPPYMVFQNLNELYVYKCNEIVSIMAPTTATNLSTLRVLEVSSCDSIEEMVACENDGDASTEITFLKLEKLKLEYLPRLKSFCRGNYSFNFPSLKKLDVLGCYMMETFCNGNSTAPSLTSEGTVRTRGLGNRWEGDLNATIRKIFYEESLRRSRYRISEQGSSLSPSESEDEGSCSNSQTLGGDPNAKFPNKGQVSSAK